VSGKTGEDEPVQIQTPGQARYEIWGLFQATGRFWQESGMIESVLCKGHSACCGD
jgi:hypothetical protein